MKLAQTLLALLALLSFTPVSATSTFPDGSVPITKDDLQQRLAGKAFTVRLADGTHWDIAFTSMGDLSVNATN
jgi:hypothetical protein